MSPLIVILLQGQPPPEGGEGERDGEQKDDKKQKENTAYAKKMVLRLAGLMGIGGAVGMVYLFGECGNFKAQVILFVPVGKCGCRESHVHLIKHRRYRKQTHSTEGTVQTCTQCAT
uniref:Uncharacterized protein n=1 Tax=Labrus bergylta TaxID=56723 RepID=A0A3Q3G1B1_9LABR